MRTYSLFVITFLLTVYLPFITTHPPEEPELSNDTFHRWRAAGNDFADWELDGTRLAAGGQLQLAPEQAYPARDPYDPGSYNGRNFYNGDVHLIGEAISPVIHPTFAIWEAVPSWNATTPAGTWVEARMRVSIDGTWTHWYSLGIWAEDDATIERHSVEGQEDSAVRIAVDTLVLKEQPATAFQLKLRLFSEDGTVVPAVQNAAVVLTPREALPAPPAGDPARWGTILPVPECSQMVYPDGGEIWCSPTSISMVLAYWEGGDGPCAPRVHEAVDGVYDWIYDGHGNWPFNTAYAATSGMEAYVTRLSSLAEAEEWIDAGVPVVISFAWQQGQLTGAPLPSSEGHIAVLVGFSREGDPVVNDPAGPQNDAVQRTYERDELERAWLENSNGTVYLIYPAGHEVPDS